jgi:hypothetical protein
MALDIIFLFVLCTVLYGTVLNLKAVSPSDIYRSAVWCFSKILI